MPQDRGRTADRFGVLIHNGGRVTDYVERFAPQTTIAGARAAAHAGLPKDTTSVWFAAIKGCSAEVLHSDQMATWFGSVIDDKSGLVLIEYFSPSSQYAATNVERGELHPGGDNPTAKSFSEC